MSPPTSSPPVPAELTERHRGWLWEVAWHYVDDAITYRLTAPDGTRRFLKLTTRGWYPSSSDEAARMRWARPHLPVPEVVDDGSDAGATWLLTRALPGADATDRTFRSDVPALVRTLGRGLRRFHEAPARDCPFDFGLETALAHARRRLADGVIDAQRDFHEEFAHLSAEEAIAELERSRPATEELVVCHGDYCLPNVLLSGGEATGFVDLGELGVADRWWDLAVGSWSVTWNLGPGHEALFLEAYGVEPDPERIRFYRLLYDVVS